MVLALADNYALLKSISIDGSIRYPRIGSVEDT
jgi:hypothetical protein